MNQIRKKIVSSTEALRKVTKWRAEGEKIVFTNGCFDLLHAGHVQYLEKASEYGKLVVALNTDRSIRRLKGSDRPIQMLEERLQILAALASVDLVLSFDEDTPKALIAQLNPDFLIKGKDYKISNIAGADIVMSNGGEVITIDLLEGCSTTAIINKIQDLNSKGG